MEEPTFDQVYSVSLLIMAYGAILDQIDADSKLGGTRSSGDRSRFLGRMKAAVRWLVEARWKGHGAWNYEVASQGRWLVHAQGGPLIENELPLVTPAVARSTLTWTLRASKRSYE